ncbi:MAG: tRNA (adenosine(37)-N6)-dimethylallyltransferase MiaA, partial [Lapillicoccus sp.]
MPDPSAGPPVVAVVGATATGKSDLALALAERLGGEVVNADAMQLYRGMDIGTAKLTLEEQRGVAHHQLDVLDVTEEASVAAYQRCSRADLGAIRVRGGQPVVVGGSGLYVRAALDELDIPPTDPAVRERLQAELDEQGVAALRARLLERDPVAAAAIEPRNGRRIVRALEVVELTGRAFSATMPTRRYLLPTVMLGLAVERPTLDRRIDLRVARMWRAGLLDEVAALLARGLRDGRTAGKALGYRQAVAQL